MAAFNHSGQPGVGKGRRAALIALAIGLFVVFAVVFSETSLNLTFIRPDSFPQTLVFAALSALIFLLFLVLTFVLARNLLKLYAERRIGVLGSAFRTRMVLGSLIISFLPVIFLFLFAYGLMNRSIDKWFSRPVEMLQEDTSQLAGLLSNYAAANARAEAVAIADAPRIKHAFSTESFSNLEADFLRHESTLQGGFVLLLQGNDEVASHRNPAAWGAMQSRLQPIVEAMLASNLRGAEALQQSSVFRWNETSYVVGAQSVGEDGRVVVGMPIPASFSTTLARMDASERRYRELSSERRLVRRFYIQMLLLLTMLTLFASTWLSLFMSRLVTKPVAALAEATKEISAGHLDYRVQVSAADELGELVKSFNRMAEELEHNRREIENSREQLANTNVALSAANTSIEQRRREIETILQNVPTGVLSLDAQRKVSHSNRAFLKLFQPLSLHSGAHLRQVFESAVAADIEHLLRRSDRMGTASREMQIAGQEGLLQVEVTAASLQHERQRLGYVIVFEDLSDLLKAQKQAAWREVARRVAHEIKNPLTPIALSAERIRRHLERGIPPDKMSLSIIEGCAETISSAVETVRTLVDEFSALARFPAARPQPANINGIVESALGMFHDRLGGISVHRDLAGELPDVLADPEAMKRVIANLVDNAAEAMQDSLLREIHISTSLLDERDAVELIVSDTGHGVTAEMKEKLFLPYFSTKERGTGLGLAIVSRIVEEHHGSVRVEENKPVGTKFIIELPVAAAVESSTGKQHV